MTNQEALAKAIRIASQAFENKFDKGGNPYILHCLYVMNEVRCLGEEAMIVAVLHDLLEDTDWSIDDLYKEGFSHERIVDLIILTHHEHHTYDSYIKNIARSNSICVAIKLADLRHNSDITRLKGLTKKDFDRLEKYCIAYEYLRKV